MAGVAQLEDYDEQLYSVTGEGGEKKYLIATSEQVTNMLVKVVGSLMLS